MAHTTDGLIADAGVLARAPAVRATKKAQREASTDRLLAVALTLFVTQGYHATTIDEIAQAAGLTKGAVYFYFRSKANLLMRLLDRVEAGCVEPTIAAMDGAGPEPRARLVAFLHSQSMIGAERAELMLLGILASIEFDRTGDPIEARLRAMFARMAAALTATIDSGRHAGVFRADLGVAEMVSAVMALSQGCLLEWYRHHGRLDGPGLVRTMRTMVMDGYCTPLAGCA